MYITHLAECQAALSLFQVPSRSFKCLPIGLREQIELQAKLLNYFLGSNKSNINQSHRGMI